MRGAQARAQPFPLVDLENKDVVVVAAKVKPFIPTYRSIMKIMQMTTFDWKHEQVPGK